MLAQTPTVDSSFLTQSVSETQCLLMSASCHLTASRLAWAPSTSSSRLPALFQIQLHSTDLILFRFIPLLLHNFHGTQLFSARGAILLFIEFAPSMEEEEGKTAFAAYINPSCTRNDPVYSYCLLMCKLLHLTGSRFHSITLFKNLYFTHIVYKSLTKDYMNGLGHCEHRCWKFVLKTLVKSAFSCLCLCW